jgi:flagellar basal body P-ring protein FlgI
MGAADASVSLDLMMRSLLSIGATPRDIAKLIQKTEAA